MSFVDFTKKQPFSDLIIISSEGDKLYFSKFALFSTSDYFKVMLNGQFKEAAQNEIKIEENTKSINSLLNAIFHGTIILSNELFDLMRLIDKYLMLDLKRTIEINISHDIDVCDMAAIINLCIEYKLELLKKTVLDRYYNGINNLDLNKVYVEVLTWQFDDIFLADLLDGFKDIYGEDNEVMNSIVKYIPMSLIEKSKNKELIMSFLDRCDHSDETSIIYSLICRY